MYKANHLSQTQQPMTNGRVTTFYLTVVNWIHSCRTPEAAENLRAFVDNSLQSDYIKETLHREIDYKVKKLTDLPAFVEIDGLYYLANAVGEKRVFVNRIMAICKMADLMLKGYDVYLSPDGSNYNLIISE